MSTDDHIPEEKPTSIAATCSWCHRLNPIDIVLCMNCRHEAHKPRMECQCTQCRTAEFVADAIGLRREPQPRAPWRKRTP